MSILTLVVITFLPEIIFVVFGSERVKIQECVNKMYISQYVWMMPHHTSNECAKTELEEWAKRLLCCYFTLYFFNLFECVQ
jgi:hypothetical protein